MSAGAPAEVYLHPGCTWFGGGHTRVRTVLGSCVAVVFWHPGRKLGGMCHFMLPGAARRGGALDARYAEDAFALMLQAIARHGGEAAGYQVKLFGGGDMFPDPGRRGGCRVGSRNVDAARRLVAQHGLPIVSEHMAGVGHRSVIFDVDSGEVWVRQLAPVRGEIKGSTLSWAA